MSGQRIAVLGAGPMGLAVAYQLARDGHHPVLFEADDRIGGMTATFDFNGLDIERYYHFHCISDSAFLRVLDELGLAGKMRWVETKMGFYYREALHAWGNPVALLKFPGLSLIAKFRYGLHAFLSTKRNDWRPLDGLEATSWIRRWVGAEAFEVLWRKLFDYKFYDYAVGLSAAWIWSRIRRIGRSRYDLFREKLGYLDGGSNTLLQAMKTDIEQRGGEILLSSPVSRVVIENGKVTGLMQNAQFLAFDKVISTVPLPYVPDLIPDLPQAILKRFRDIKNIAVVCVIAKLRKRLTENFWLNTNDEEMDIPGLVEYTNLRPLDHHIVYVPFYMPAEHAKFADPDSVFLDKVRRYLGKINPALVDEDFIELRASRYRYAQPICEPGYLDSLPPVSLPVAGLWVADTSYYYPEDRGISESIDFRTQNGRDGKRVIQSFASQEFLRFLLTGGTAAAVNFGSRILFNNWMSYSSAIILAYLMGMVTAFVLARMFVFKASTQNWQRSAMIFALVNVVAVAQTWAISMALAYYLLPAIGVTAFVPEIAHAAGVVFPVFTSYLGHKHWSFR